MHDSRAAQPWSRRGAIGRETPNTKRPAFVGAAPQTRRKSTRQTHRCTTRSNATQPGAHHGAGARRRPTGQRGGENTGNAPCEQRSAADKGERIHRAAHAAEQRQHARQAEGAAAGATHAACAATARVGMAASSRRSRQSMGRATCAWCRGPGGAAMPPPGRGLRTGARGTERRCGCVHVCAPARGPWGTTTDRRGLWHRTGCSKRSAVVNKKNRAVCAQYACVLALVS